MAIAPSYMRRKPLSSMLDFAEERAREAASLGDVITKLAQPTLTSMGAAPEPAVQRGPAPAPQKLGTMTGPATVTRAGGTIDPATITDPLFRSMVKQESGFRTDAVSPKGATGVAQIMPSTAVDPGFGVPSIFDLADASGIDYSSRTQDEAKRLLLQQPDLNLQFGQLYKNAMSDRYGGDPKLTAAAYNAGAGAVDQYGGVPPFAETQGYVAAVVPGANGLTVSTKGGGFGGAPQNVEDILGSLYPQTSPEDEKRLRRKDFLAAAGQGLSALSQGGTVDFTNIRQAAEARRQQGVMDMRERERARAAAALVYNQTGDADMAGAIASGAIQYGDVINERERQRIERDADIARVQQAQASGTLAKVYADVLPDLGIPEAARATIVEGIASGLDPATLLAPNQLAKVADGVRAAEDAAAEAAAMRADAITKFSTSGTPVQQLAAQYMATSDMSLEAALKLANDQMVVPETFAPSEIQKTWDASREAAKSRGPEALAQFDAQYPTPADLQMAVSGKLGGVPSQVDALNADLMGKGLLVTPDPANPTMPLVENGQIVTTEIEGGPAQVERLKLEQATEEEAAKQTVLADKAALGEQKARVADTNTMRLLSDVYDKAKNFSGDPLSSFVRGIVADVFKASEAGQAQGQLEGVKVGVFVDELTDMRQYSPTGAAVGNVTDGERKAFESTYGALQIAGSPKVLQENLRAMANAALDMQYGTPAALRQAVKDGKLDAATAERYGARYDVDGTADTGLAGELGAVVPLGLAPVDETILTAPVAPEEAAVSPDSPDPEYEAMLIQNPDLLEDMPYEEYKNLPPKQKEIVDRLLEGN